MQYRSQTQHTIYIPIYTKSHYLWSVYLDLKDRTFNKKSPDYIGAVNGKRFQKRWYEGFRRKLSDDGVDKSGFQCFVCDVHNVIGIRPDQETELFNDYVQNLSERYNLGRKDNERGFLSYNIEWQLIDINENINEITEENKSLRGKIEKLLTMTVKNGCTPAEEDTARSMLRQLYEELGG